MTIPADSLPGDHLRAEEREEGKRELCRVMQAHAAPRSDASSVLSECLEKCLAVDTMDGVHLDADEREDIREYLQGFMEGFRSQSLRRESSFLERFFEYFSDLSRSTFPRMIAACCVLLILGNTVALAASETVPGDTLYPVKVNVIEPVVAAVVVTPEKKAAWASTCIRRRLVEAERLIAQDRLTAETWSTLNTSIAANAKVAERHIISLSKHNAPEAAELSANLHLAISAHGQVFSDIVQTKKQNVVAIAAADLSNVAAETARLYEETEAVAWTDEFGTEKAADHVIQTASSAAFYLSDTADSQQAKERGNKAREFLKNAQDRFEDGKFHESLRDARMAAQKAEEGNTFMRMGLKFDMDGKVSSEDSSLLAAPVTVCGATLVEVSIPAVISPVSSHQSELREKKDKSEEKSERSSSAVSTSMFSSTRVGTSSSTGLIDPPSVLEEIPLLH